MISHVFKMVWNRKAQNSLILLEIFVSLLVLFAVGAVGISTWDRYQQPLGFDYQDVWELRASAESGRSAEPQVDQTLRVLADELEQQDAVQTVGRSLFGLYTGSGMRTSFEDVEGRRVVMEMIPAGLDFQGALDVELLAGRWFLPEDRESQHTAIIINSQLATEVFGLGVDPVGQTIYEGGEQEGESDSYQVVGWVQQFRKAGELSSLEPTALYPIWLEDPSRGGFTTFLLEMKAGADSQVEEQLIRSLQAIAPQWSFDLDRLTDSRRSHLRDGFAPLLAGGTVAVFLMLMVALGLTGVLWQNVTRRTREIGLRRAQGATAVDVRRQIVLEMLVLATFGICLGLVVVVQLPLFGVMRFLDAGTLISAFGVAGLLLYALTAACAYYPCRLATEIRPAEALHYE